MLAGLDGDDEKAPLTESPEMRVESMKAEIKSLKQLALQEKNAGNKQQALVYLRNFKALEVELKEFEGSMLSTAVPF